MSYNMLKWNTAQELVGRHHNTRATPHKMPQPLFLTWITPLKTQTHAQPRPTTTGTHTCLNGNKERLGLVLRKRMIPCLKRKSTRVPKKEETTQHRRKKSCHMVENAFCFKLSGKWKWLLLGVLSNQPPSQPQATQHETHALMSWGWGLKKWWLHTRSTTSQK